MGPFEFTRRGLLACCTAGLAGCGLLPEEQDPVEASATAPAYLPESVAADTGYTPTIESETTVETTIRIDLSGDVQMTNRREVVATVFRRVYAADDGRRFGLVTAPAVQVIEQPEVIRDPVTALEPSRAVELATDTTVEEVSGWTTDGTRTVLNTEASRERSTATTDAGEVTLDRVRVRAGDDSVTAMAATPDGVDRAAPFDDVARDG